MKKRAQTLFGMSFGVIFSIFIIIAIIAVAIYAITIFVGTGSCSKVTFFYEDLQEEIDKAWTSGIYQGSFEGTLPGEITHVCIGKLSNSPNSDYRDFHSDLEYYYSGSGDANVFLYPTEKACDGEFFSEILTHVDDLGAFNCAPVQEDKVSVFLEKQTTDSLVKISV